MATVEAVIAANVRARRARLNWQPIDLARRLGWSIAQVSDLEAGHRSLHARDLPLLCEVLGIGLSELLERTAPGDVAARRNTSSGP